MVKLATRPKRAPTAPIKSVKGRKPETLTHEGGTGFNREAKSELFLLAVTNMVSENTFYENGKNRDKRFVDLIKQVALEDPDWIARFVPYLRSTMNMRSASIVMAAELVHAKLTKPVPREQDHQPLDHRLRHSAGRRARRDARLLDERVGQELPAAGEARRGRRCHPPLLRVVPDQERRWRQADPLR